MDVGGARVVRLNLKNPTVSYLAKCIFTGGLVIFVCMAAGELLVNPNMFRGFLGQPHIWPLIFIETAVWAIPCVAISLPLIRALRGFSPRSSAIVVSSIWVAISLIFLGAYNAVYFSGRWSWAELARADMTFGWTIPGLIILVLYIIHSLTYLEKIRLCPTRRSTQ
jgi:hypothetical protein